MTTGMNMEPRGNILPIYFVADESGSMGPDIAELNSGLQSLLNEIRMAPFAAANVRFSVIGFDNEARLYLSNADLRHVEQMPTLTARYATYFSTAFDLLNAQIPDDVAQLKAEGYRVNRPAVFLLTDGYPMSDDLWQEALSDLQNAPHHPNILAFGIGESDAQIIGQMASKNGWAFQAAQGADTGAMLSEFMSSLTQSVISSGTSVANGSPEIITDIPDDFVKIDMDEL
ncbi:VWA domain-containing protein [Corynebacterium amycolatum]|uniref:VWA domain-containing protein n=1 Tax=Corynebacterium amycolatum TaxID=43765 RepID=UPI000660DB7F|nr:VWA domain-containing protein [Corynebacterium sp.]